MLVMNDRAFDRIVAFVRDNYGINLSKKRALIQARLTLDIERRGYASFDQYFEDVIAHPSGSECQHMIDKLSTNHTFFFREQGCFQHMRDIAVPEFIRRGVRHIEVWCAASSTGQECYSAAMMLEEALALHSNVTYHILGSDINAEVLQTAKCGVYPIKELDSIPTRFHKRYCSVRDDDSFGIAPCLKERITWKPINLVKLPGTLAPDAFHLIFCRNVMIYFEQPTKEALTSELYRLVCDDGYVYVGSTETLDIKRTRFQYLAPSVFRKRQVSP